MCQRAFILLLNQSPLSRVIEVVRLGGESGTAYPGTHHNPEGNENQRKSI